MRLSEMANNVEHQSIEIPFIIDDEEELIEIEPLKKLEWGRLYKNLDENMWKKLIDATAKIQDSSSDDEEQRGMMEIMGELHDEIQLEMWYQKFRNEDSDITRKQVDDLVTFGIKNQQEYFRGLMWMFQGVDITEAREELEDVGGSGNPSTDLEDEQ